MKANEIRINNYHYYHIEDRFDERKEWDELCQIDPDDLKWLLKNPDDPIYKPVPLTEDWLIKFGFKNNTDCAVGYERILRSGHAIHFFNPELYCYLQHIALDDIKYVHQLQNLFHALTGQELTIKSDNQ